MDKKGGLFLVFVAALISGVSIFVNKFGVSGINPYIFTWLKSIVVFVLLFSSVILFRELNNLKQLTKKQWLNLSLIGLVGGSIPFLLFFKGLSLTSSAMASFTHKTMFIYVGIMAVIFLKEKLNKGILIGAVLLLAGNFFLLKLTSLSFGFGDLLILCAAIFWAVETILAKRLLENVSPRVVAFCRMFFGSIFILVFLFASGNIGAVANTTSAQLVWVLITSALLFGYTFTWYWGLKYVEATTATCILLIGSAITTALNLFSGSMIGLSEWIGMSLLIAGVILVVGWKFISEKIRNYIFSIANP